MKRYPVSISAVGCVSAAGENVEANLQALRLGRSGLARVEGFDITGCRASTAGEVRKLSLPPRVRRWSRAAGFLYSAVCEALAARPAFDPEWIIVGTTSGGMELGEQFFRAARAGHALVRAARGMRGYLPQTPPGDVARAFGLRAPVRVLSNACSSGADAVGLGWQLVSSGAARRVLACGCDALSQFVFCGFDSLQALTTTLCRPFDCKRDGLALGEGAAALCLERDGPVEIAGYGAFTDIHHLTQPDPSGTGPLAAMHAALAAANLDPAQIDHVNAHGTATLQNDACEARALTALCPHAPVTSTKAATGHTLGAAGAIEAVYSCLAITHGLLPPTLNFSAPDDGVALDIIMGTPRDGSPRVVLSNSFGFGGANASLVFRAA